MKEKGWEGEELGKGRKGRENRLGGEEEKIGGREKREERGVSRRGEGREKGEVFEIGDKIWFLL